MSSNPADAARAAATQQAGAEVTRRTEQLLQLSRQIHENPELAWEEHSAARTVADAMREAGFAVELGAYGLSTAVEAVYGESDFTVAICAEYDALPGIGHACGHNVIAAAGVGAALALAPLAEEAGLRIKLLGTPAEEHGGGKAAMLEAGAWEDVDISLMAHGTTLPAGSTGDSLPCSQMRSMAVARFDITFTGQAAHAAAAPDKGINAGNAAILALNAIGLLRQQLPKDTNLNAFISHGGDVTNIIPGTSEVGLELRAFDIAILREMKAKVMACFEGAAIATGCTWDYELAEPPYAPVEQEPVLGELWDAHLVSQGRVLSDAQPGSGSTDMGNVSLVVPSIHPMITFIGEDAAPHSPAFTDAAITPAADRALLDAAQAMAATVLDVALDPQMRGDYQGRRRARPEGATRQPFLV